MIIEELKKYTEFVTGIPALRITFGQYGMMRNSLGHDGVIISELASVVQSRNFTYVNEVEYLTVNYESTFTFGFFGVNALDNATLFTAMQHSQAGHEWVRDNGIDIHSDKIRSLGELYKKSKVNLYEVEATCFHAKKTLIGTKRIDTLTLDKVIVNN